jgi:DNA-binding LacI/PurR family transcriptional regulator
LSDDTRKMAFIKVLEEAGIEITEKWIYTGSKRFEECGYEGMKKILSEKSLPTAVFAAYDDIAIGAMKAIYEQGLIIPEDISIAAIDDIRMSKYLYPGLTTVACPIMEMARIAVSTLMERIESNENRSTQIISLNPELVIRKSVDFPKIS